MKNTIVINLIGGPGCGKSTAAAGIFYLLKKQGINCEMSLEFAKDKVWEQSIKTLDNQIYVFGKQHHRLWRIVEKVDVVITDSPLFLSLYYNKEPSKQFDEFVISQFKRFNNRTFFIERGDSSYQQSGRLQNEQEAREIDRVLKELLEKYNVEYQSVEQSTCVEEIVSSILTELSDG